MTSKRKSNISKNIVYKEYVDASYAYKKTRKLPNPVHSTVGRLIRSNDDIVLSFQDYEEAPVKGLIIPKKAIVGSRENRSIIRKLIHLPKGTRIGIHWDDIVYFNEGKLPSKKTTAYTEGEFMKIEDNQVMVDEPETLLFRENGKVINHPTKKAKRYYIPVQLISAISIYE